MKGIILTLLLMLFTLTGCSFDNTSIMNREKVVIGFDESFAPMGFRNEEGEIIGFDIDLAKEAARRLGVEVEFKPIDWTKKKEEITSGNVDMLWNGCDITDERRSYLIYSKPYMDNRQILVVKRGNTQNIYSIKDLEGKVVGTQAGSNSVDYVEQDEDLKNSFEAFKTYLNYKEAFEDLDKDLVDILIADEITARYEMTRSVGKFEIIEITVGATTEIGIAFRKDNVELRDRIQKVFDDMVKDGTARKISEQWFQADLIKLKR